jgi:hypothetical protein
MFGFRWKLFDLKRKCRGKTRPRLEWLENRNLPSTVTLGVGFNGGDNNNGCQCAPPDAGVAVGPSHIVEAINNEIYIYDKVGNLVTSLDSASFYKSVSKDPRGDYFDPTAFYDDISNQFFVGFGDVNFGSSSTTQTSHYDYAVSTGNDVTSLTSGWTWHTINTKLSGTWGDFPHVGYDSDAYVLTSNQFSFSSGLYSKLEMNVVKKSSFQDFRSSQTNASFTEFPARMHGAGAGTLYLVQENGFENGRSIQVDKVTNYFTTTPTVTRTNLTVTSYSVAPAAVSPGNSNLDTGDTRINSAAWRNNTLVATQDIGTNGVSAVRWYVFNTSGTPTLSQSGSITPGSGIYTYYGAMDIDPNGDLGMSYMESSSTQKVSVYDVGELSGGSMSAGVLAVAGTNNFTQFDSNPHRAGDYSAIAVDPSTNNFWIENEYAGSHVTGIGDYGTFISNFTVTTPADRANSEVAAALLNSQNETNSAAQMEAFFANQDIQKVLGINPYLLDLD